MNRGSVVGKYTGDGSNAVGVDLGFRPSKVEIVNVTDGDKKFEILDDGADGKCLLTNDSGSNTTDLSIVTEPTLNNRGFNTGTHASIIESAKVFVWVAYR